MAHLSDTTIDELQDVLERVDDKTPAQRLIAAIAYKHGITQTDLADWFDVERKTIYNWLTRLEKRDVESASSDDQRPGRPRKLSEEQADELQEALHESPTEVGIDAPAWTTALVRRFISDRFGIAYSRPSCRRLMKEAGLRSRTATQAVAAADVTDRDSFEQEVQDLGPVWMPR